MTLRMSSRYRPATSDVLRTEGTARFFTKTFDAAGNYLLITIGA
ncbi:MAG: hypothetical protein R3E84_21345 [Pseudomonadales bacterium]